MGPEALGRPQRPNAKHECRDGDANRYDAYGCIVPNREISDLLHPFAKAGMTKLDVFKWRKWDWVALMIDVDPRRLCI
jgi:hypothetical protein